MAVEPGYPVTLVHPQHRAAMNAVGDAIGAPERFPSVTVNGANQEAQYRAQGYLRYGEAQPAAIDHHEYPKMMRHPEYVPAVEARVEAKIDNGRIVGTFTIPAKPAEHPDVSVLNAEQEEKARASGYRPAGEYNRSALEAVLNGTVDEELYEPDEYPKWVNGTLIEHDPDAEPEYTPTPEYPRYENGVLVQDPRAPEVIDPNLYPMWVHRNGVPSDASVLVKTPKEEFEVRAKWKREEEAEVEPKSEPELPLVSVAPAPKPRSPTAKILERASAP